MIFQWHWRFGQISAKTNSVSYNLISKIQHLTATAITAITALTVRMSAIQHHDSWNSP